MHAGLGTGHHYLLCTCTAGPDPNAVLILDEGGLAPEMSDLFHSALADEYYDVYSDVYHDTGAP